ncbi:hypothetical protein LXM94_01945 [Rhizobium sp. TRM95111]|uniref:hypothetical protein n=1 Tax=Rhizobium alarense TaxID=2846851 RepID=UPI001F2A8411|nr:hypothetical protein [Rhizobium alarense]MCF3638733.1 hypothetical protein [Rhizobium alarense]
MKLIDVPDRFNIPFADSAGGGFITYPIPEASQIGISDGRASLTDGFPPQNFLPVGAGGVPPFGQDTNGLLKQITEWNRWQGAGSPVPYSSAFSTAIGGYPQGALLASTTFTGFWLNAADDNTTDPDAGGTNWLPFFPYPQETLAANRTYYVSTTGSDSNDGLTSGTAWATLQHAWDFVLANINLAGYNITIDVEDGTYTSALTASGVLTGAPGPGSFQIVGNTGTPANVVLSTAGDCIRSSNNAQIMVRGMRLTSSGASCFATSRGGTLEFDTIEFNTAAVSHINASGGSLVTFNGAYSIVGASPFHYQVTNKALLAYGTVGSAIVTLTGTPAFTQFAFCSLSALIGINSGLVTYSGSATGSRYTAILGGNIYTFGGGANYFPGNSAGSTATGGLYN